MSGSPTSRDQVLDLERCRAYLHLLARMQMGKKLRDKLEPADLVQQTLLDAHENLALFRGETEAELRGWLRQILAANLVKNLRFLSRHKRDSERECSMQAALDASSLNLERWLVAEQSSPSANLQRHELEEKLLAALAQLSEGQREALLMRHCQGLTFAEIGERLGCTAPSVVGLLRRASDRLREMLRE